MNIIKYVSVVLKTQKMFNLPQRPWSKHVKLGAGFMKPCALLKLDFLTGAYNKCIALVRKSSFSKAQGIHVTGPSAYAVVPIDKGLFCISVVSYVPVRSG